MELLTTINVLILSLVVTFLAFQSYQTEKTLNEIRNGVCAAVMKLLIESRKKSGTGEHTGELHE